MPRERPITYGSLFAGAGGFDLGFEAAGGYRCAWQVEIMDRARGVLARHWPLVPRFADVRDCSAKNLTPVDVIVGGFPCQDLSVSGKRGGLSGERSGLFYELARIACELQPRFLVFENVPGLLSSDDGRDFGRVLRHLGDGGYCHGAWRVLDAQFFGVAQRRRRVFGVFARRDVGAERCGEILALLGRVRGDSPAGRRSGNAHRAGAAGGVGGTGRGTTPAVDGGGCTVERDVAASVLARGHPDNTQKDNFVLAAVQDGRCIRKSQNGLGLSDGETAYTLDTTGASAVVFNALSDGSGSDKVTPTLRAMGNAAGVNGNGGGQLAVYCEVAGTLGGQGGKKGRGGLSDQQVRQGHLAGTILRRLTPRENERLQGWGDDHTRWTADGKEVPDGPRYHMIGNGVAAPVAAWLARRIKADFQLHKRGKQ